MAATKPTLSRGEVFELRRAIDEQMRWLLGEANRLDSTGHHADATGFLGRACRLRCVLDSDLEGMLTETPETRIKKLDGLCRTIGCLEKAWHCKDHSS